MAGSSFADKVDVSSLQGRKSLALLLGCTKKGGSSSKYSDVTEDEQIETISVLAAGGVGRGTGGFRDGTGKHARGT